MSDKEKGIESPCVVKSHDIRLDNEYVDWIQSVKNRYHNSQIKAAVKVNSEQLLFNWELGRDLVERKAEEKWGSGIVEQVSLDLQAAFPNVKGFISLPENYDEEALEDAIERRMTRFLLELGEGWAFVGRQKEIIVAGKTRKIDLLFYHIYLRCYVVLELKVKPFDPEFAGKLNFYVNSVNQFIKRESDNTTLGLLICKDMDRTEVQLAFQGITTPMGVATYENIRIKEIEEHLPTAEQIRQQIEIAEREYMQSTKAAAEDVQV